MEPADSIARMVTGSAHWLAEMLGKERVHIGRTRNHGFSGGEIFYVFEIGDEMEFGNL